MIPAEAELVDRLAALGDRTRWSVLSALGDGQASATVLSSHLPVTRQAIAKHLRVLEEVGLVEAVVVRRERQYRVLGSELHEVARRLDRIGNEWDRRLAAIKRIAEEA